MTRKKSPKTTVSVRILPKHKRLLARYARGLDMTPSAYIETLIHAHVLTKLATEEARNP